MKRLVHLICLIAALWCGFLATGCGGKGGTQGEAADSLEMRLHDTIVVGTLYSPTSYFIYRGDPMGYHYDLIQKFAKDNHVHIQFKTVRNMAVLLSLLDSAKIDIIAYNIPMTAEFKKQVRHCGIENINHQVLIQPAGNNKPRITDVTQLVGKTVVVEKGSKYESRMRNLNNELGGGIKIEAIRKDTLISEDMIEMVAEGEIPLTVVDSDIAKLNHTYYDNIDIGLAVSFPQKSAWAVREDDKWLAEAIDRWAKRPEVTQSEKELYKHYFEQSKLRRSRDLDMRNLRRGEVSAYDNLFKTYAKTIGWDWRLLAAQGYVESHFDPNATSWAGARGLMQLMPRTAAHYGRHDGSITDPDNSVYAASRYIADLNRILSSYVKDRDERIKFILAAYNSGIAHIYDAIALARKHGKNPALWHDNVSEALMMKSNPEYYNDPVCRYGYFRGRQTVEYVKEVTRVYERFKGR